MNLPDKSVIYSFLEKNNIDSGNAKAFYHFTGASGYLIYNNLLTPAEHYNSSDQLLASSFPGISVGQTDNIQTTSAGVGDKYGVFDSSGAVKIAADIDYEGWTVFMHIEEVTASSPQSSLPPLERSYYGVVPRDGRTIPEIRDVDERQSRRQSRTHGGSPAKSDCQIRLRHATGN